MCTYLINLADAFACICMSTIKPLSFWIHLRMMLVVQCSYPQLGKIGYRFVLLSLSSLPMDFLFIDTQFDLFLHIVTSLLAANKYRSRKEHKSYIFHVGDHRGINNISISISMHLQIQTIPPLLDLPQM